MQLEPTERISYGDPTWSVLPPEPEGLEVL